MIFISGMFPYWPLPNVRQVGEREIARVISSYLQERNSDDARRAPSVPATQAAQQETGQCASR